MPSSVSPSPIVKLVSVAVLIVVVGVFIGLTLCTTLHSPVESFSSCSRQNNDGSHDSINDPTEGSPAKKKCIRVISRAQPPLPPPTLAPSTIVITPPPMQQPTESSTLSENSVSNEASKACAKKKEPQECPKTVYCPPCPKCPAPCPRMCPDMSKYVLKTSIPPCPVAEVDREIYMLKSECQQPDLSKYILKSKLPSFKKPPCPPCDQQSSETQTKDQDKQNTNAPQNESDEKTTESAKEEEANASNTNTNTNNSSDLFGEKGVLGDQNMVAWNDNGIGGGGYGASVKESTTFTDSCVKPKS